MNTYIPNYKPESCLYEIGQKVVIFNQDRQILLLRRSNKTTRAGGWDFPGGRLENEQPLDGMSREVEEECGLKIENPRILTITTVHDGGKNILLIGYIASCISSAIKLSWEHDLFKWVSIDEASSVELPPLLKVYLNLSLNSFTKVNKN